MVAYPGVNDGAVPVDPTTEVGQFRVILGDVQAEAYTPPEPGRGNYEMFSDEDIEGYIAAGGSFPRGVGFAYLALAGRAAVESKSVKDFDLSIDTTKRPTELRLLAQSWFDRADKEEAAAQDAFFVAPLGDSCDMIPEGSTPRWGRRAVGGWEC